MKVKEKQQLVEKKNASVMDVGGIVNERRSCSLDASSGPSKSRKLPNQAFFQQRENVRTHLPGWVMVNHEISGNLKRKR